MYLLNVLTQRNLYLLDRTFYYLSKDKVNVGVRVNIKFNNSQIVGYVISSEEINKSKEEIEDEVGMNLNFIDSIIDEKPILTEELMKLAFELKKKYVYPLIGVLQTMLPPSLKPKHTYINAAKIKIVKFYEVFWEKVKDFELNKNELKLLEKLKGKKRILKSELNLTKSLETLIQKGIIHEKEEEAFRYKINTVFKDYEKRIILTENQKEAYEKIVDSKQNVVLLKGVTGSGKTEIYIELIKKYIAEGKGAIVLVPEIALTPLMISRLYNFFDDKIAVLHSSLTSAEIYDEYRKISEGKASVVIGTRSAVFAPVKNLGLIIIDEENDECYKQDDQGLLYNAKDVAYLRAKLENAKVILGSATPSIEDYAKAKNGSFALVELDERYGGLELPYVFLIDNKNYKNYSSKSRVFSLELIRQLENVISEGKQAILFINRRGFASYLSCRECGHVFKCPHCGLPLHYHKEKNILYCHHCEYQVKKPKVCPKCSSTFLSYGHFGIEKVEEDFKKLFPNVKYLVLDSDRTSKTFQIEKVLTEFNEGKASVLIGTQLVAKGHDFNNVKLVGVLNADTLLNFPNYRSNEMTFSLLTQVIGRAGRKNEKGIAIIQSSETTNSAIIQALKQDYDAFYHDEISKRKVMSNPPFKSILSIEISSDKPSKLDDFVKRVKNYFISLDLEDVEVLGPSILHYNKFKSWKNIFIKYKKLSVVIEHIEALLEVYKLEKNVSLKLNFNPYSF